MKAFRFCLVLLALVFALPFALVGCGEQEPEWVAVYSVSYGTQRTTISSKYTVTYTPPFAEDISKNEYNGLLPITGGIPLPDEGGQTRTYTLKFNQDGTHAQKNEYVCCAETAKVRIEHIEFNYLYVKDFGEYIQIRNNSGITTIRNAEYSITYFLE